MLCPICRHLNVLCQVCEAALSNGKLTKAEIDITRQMTRLKTEVSVKAAFDLGRKLVVQVGPGESTKIRNLWKEYVVFEDEVDIEALLSPVKLRKTRIFLPNGTEGERFVASRGELKASGFDLKALEHALTRLGVDSVRFI